jgi:hypothetical protein
MPNSREEDYMSMQLKVTDAFMRIGVKNGTAPQSQDPADEVLHEYMVASTLAACAEKRKAAAKDAVIEICTHR